MAQYIDKATLLAKIKKLKMDIGNIFNEYDEGFWEGRTTAFDDVICALDPIEMKEVDLDEEIKLWFDYGLPNNEELLDYIKETAKRFFELGLKAKEKYGKD